MDGQTVAQIVHCAGVWRKSYIFVLVFLLFLLLFLLLFDLLQNTCTFSLYSSTEGHYNIESPTEDSSTSQYFFFFLTAGQQKNPL